MLKQVAAKMASVMKRFAREDGGVVAMIFALSIPMFIGSTGVAVDLAQGYNVKNRLSDALDKAALAGGSTPGTTAQVTDRVQKFFNANYPADKLGHVTYFNVDVNSSDRTVTVTAHAEVDTVFMSVFGEGYSKIQVESEAKVKRELSGVEAVLVMDVTGSMAGSRISSLRTAAENFVNIMFTNVDPAFVKIGLVPFSQTVNVGRYGLGRTPANAIYDGGTAFVNRPATDRYTSPASNIAYGTGTNNWAGCVLERASPDDTSDATSPNWVMYRYNQCRQCNSNGTCRTYQTGTTPNTYCPTSPLVPLTNSSSTLVTNIRALQAVGSTYINVGAVWGLRVLTPSFPFREGVALNDEEWTKTMVIMTDGDNSANGSYSAYGEESCNNNITNAVLNAKFTTTCNNAKAAGVTVYTVAFGTDINAATANLLRGCASDPGKYFVASNGTALNDAFEDIANQLSKLHIVH